MKNTFKKPAKSAFFMLTALVVVSLVCVKCKKEEPPRASDQVTHSRTTKNYTAAQQKLLASIRVEKIPNSGSPRPLVFTLEQCASAAAIDGVTGGLAATYQSFMQLNPNDIVLKSIAVSVCGSFFAFSNHFNLFDLVIPAVYPTNGPYNDFDENEYKNANNPYDFAGDFHNETIDGANASFSTYMNNGVVEFTPYVDAVNSSLSGIAGSAVEMDMPEGDFNNYYSLVSDMNYTIQERLEHLRDEAGFPDYYTDVLIAFFDGVDNCNSAEDMVTYARNVENDINASAISENDKRVLLVTMAIFRYSYGYWCRVATKQ